METYTHRAGRTGRMGKEGYVITLVTHPEELKKLKKFASVREIVLKNQELYNQIRLAFANLFLIPK